MALVLSEDEVMLVDSVRSLLARSAPVSALRALRDSGAALRYDRAVFAELAGAGFVAPHVPEAEGGLGMGAAAAGLIAEQCGHTLAAAPLLSSAMAATVLVAAGSDAQKADLLPQIIAGQLLVAVAFDESARHDPQQLAATARASGDGWTVSGSKRNVIDGIGANLLIVSALDAGKPSLFLVEAQAAGVEIKALDLIDSRNAADIHFSKAPATRLTAGDAGEAINAALDLGRAVLAAELLGIANNSFDRTVQYLKEREQFGRKIGTYQALQHRAARLYARLDLAQAVVLKALRAIDENDPQRSMLASLSKGTMTKLARDVLVEAVQMHGGIGVTDEFDLGLFFKRSRAAGELLGDDYFHTERLASEHWQL